MACKITNHQAKFALYGTFSHLLIVSSKTLCLLALDVVSNWLDHFCKSIKYFEDILMKKSKMYNFIKARLNCFWMTGKINGKLKKKKGWVERVELWEHLTKNVFSGLTSDFWLHVYILHISKCCQFLSLVL